MEENKNKNKDTRNKINKTQNHNKTHLIFHNFKTSNKTSINCKTLFIQKAESDNSKI